MEGVPYFVILGFQNRTKKDASYKISNFTVLPYLKLGDTK